MDWTTRGLASRNTELAFLLGGETLSAVVPGRSL
jgi:hypothetical protein